jgi:hypothetical protein
MMLTCNPLYHQQAAISSLHQRSKQVLSSVRRPRFHILSLLSNSQKIGRGLFNVRSLGFGIIRNSTHCIGCVCSAMFSRAPLSPIPISTSLCCPLHALRFTFGSKGVTLGNLGSEVVTLGSTSFIPILVNNSIRCYCDRKYRLFEEINSYPSRHRVV